MCLPVEIWLTDLPKTGRGAQTHTPDCDSPDSMFHSYRKPGLMDFKNNLSFDCNVSIKFRIANQNRELLKLLLYAKLPESQ